MIAADPCCASGRFLMGYFAVLTGLAIDALFIPVWAVGATRISQLKETEIYKERQKLSIRLSPAIQIIESNNRITFGFAAAVRF